MIDIIYKYITIFKNKKLLYRIQRRRYLQCKGMGIFLKCDDGSDEGVYLGNYYPDHASEPTLTTL